MTLHGPATRLTIFVGESHTWHQHPLYAEIVHRAHRAGLAGASVFRGIEGFGASSRIHTNRLFALGQQVPVAIVIVDDDERIKAFLPELDEIVQQGLVILDEVEVYRYAPGADRDAPERRR
jgi:PII-like signaling protein